MISASFISGVAADVPFHQSFNPCTFEPNHSDAFEANPAAAALIPPTSPPFASTNSDILPLIFPIFSPTAPANAFALSLAVFAKDKNAEDAKKEGADFVGADDLVQKIQDGFLDFDRVIASPDMMGSVSKVAKILGPKGLMPNPKMGTVTPNVGEAVKLVKSGQVQFKAEKNGIVQAGIAKSNFGAKNIVENINSFVDTIKKSKPSGAKGTFIKKISLSSTMGVSVNCEIN